VRDVASSLHELDAHRKLLEVGLLRGLERIPAEERNDPLYQLCSTSDDVLAQVLLVVVMTPVDEHATASEEPLKLFEHMIAACRLRHDEPGAHLNPGSVAGAARSTWLPNETDREASFSVYKAGYPATKLDQPFLLIFRTRHVVTLDIPSDGSSSAGYTGFSSIWPDAHHTITGVGGNDSPEQLHTVLSGMSP
jgi:hypothetical protein